MKYPTKMKTLLVLATLLTATSAFAMSDAKLAEKCAKRGEEKINSQALSYDCKLSDSIEVFEVDNRLLNPSKYIWYKQSAECENGYTDVTVMVQYDSFSRECI